MKGYLQYLQSNLTKIIENMHKTIHKKADATAVDPLFDFILLKVYSQRIMPLSLLNSKTPLLIS